MVQIEVLGIDKDFLLEAKELRLMPEQEKALESQLEDKIIMVNKTTKTKKSKMVSNEGVAHILATFYNYRA